MNRTINGLLTIYGNCLRIQGIMKDRIKCKNCELNIGIKSMKFIDYITICELIQIIERWNNGKIKEKTTTCNIPYAIPE